MRPFLFGVLFTLIIGGLFYLLQPATPPTQQDPRIATLTAERDSLDGLLSARVGVDTVYLTRYKTIAVKTDSAKTAVAALPPTEAVRFFAAKTGTDSIEMLPDTTAKVTMPTIKAANMLIIEGEGAKQTVAVMTTHLASKDTTISLQAERIQTTDSLSTVTNAQHSRDLSAAKAEAKREKKLKNIFLGATSLEAALILLSMFF